MAEVPVSQAILEQLAVNVSLALLEEWAIQGRVPEGELEKYSSLAVEDTLFVINTFMETFNNVMKDAQVSQIQAK